MKPKKELKLMLVSFFEELCDKVLVPSKERSKQNAAVMTAIMRKIKDAIKLIDKLE